MTVDNWQATANLLHLRLQDAKNQGASAEEISSLERDLEYASLMLKLLRDAAQRDDTVEFSVLLNFEVCRFKKEAADKEMETAKEKNCGLAMTIVDLQTESAKAMIFAIQLGR